MWLLTLTCLPDGTGLLLVPMCCRHHAQAATVKASAWL